MENKLDTQKWLTETKFENTIPLENSRKTLVFKEYIWKETTQPEFIFSKLTIEALEQGVKHVRC